MARRAQQGAVARCPYCEASLPQVAAECPQCRFPLTMAAADSGFRSGDRMGTTSTATPGARPTPPVLPGSAAAAVARARVHGSRGHRMRVTAWLLGVTSILLLLAGVGALFTASSTGATSDRLAQASIVKALQVTGDDPSAGQEADLTILGPNDVSDRADRVSVATAENLWFGAAKSAGGSCFFLAVRRSDGVRGAGTLDSDGPCTGAEARLRSEQKLRTSKA